MSPFKLILAVVFFAALVIAPQMLFTVHGGWTECHPETVRRNQEVRL